jgi:putative spermidine/putrescine transport system permease protein
VINLKRTIPPYILFLSPILIFLLLFLLYPLAWMTGWSFLRYVPIKITDGHLTLGNYARFLLSPFYLSVLFKTIELSFLVTLITLALGYPVAYYFVKSSPRIKRIGIFLVVMPIMIGLVVRTYGLMILFEERGPINQMLVGLGLVRSPIQILDTPFAAMVGLVEMFLPFAVLPLISSLEKIDPSVEEAAKVLGCNSSKLFLKVTLPLSIPGILSGSLLVFSMAMTAYVTPALLGGHSMMLMATLVYQQMMTSFNWPFGTAIAMILILVTAALMTGYMRIVRARGRGA